MVHPIIHQPTNHHSSIQSDRIILLYWCMLRPRGLQRKIDSWRRYRKSEKTWSWQSFWGGTGGEKSCRTCGTGPGWDAGSCGTDSTPVGSVAAPVPCSFESPDSLGGTPEAVDVHLGRWLCPEMAAPFVRTTPGSGSSRAGPRHSCRIPKHQTLQQREGESESERSGEGGSTDVKGGFRVLWDLMGEEARCQFYISEMTKSPFSRRKIMNICISNRDFGIFSLILVKFYPSCVLGLWYR